MDTCIFGCSWWHDLGPQVQQAVVGGVIGGLFTVLTAAISVLIVTYQLKSQARAARETNEHSEALKLKKQIYDDVRKLCDAVSADANALDRFTDNFTSAVSRTQYPHGTVQDFSASGDKLINSLSDIVRSARSWTITHPRMAHFRDVFETAISDGTIAAIDFYGASFRHFPDRSVQPAHWKEPDAMQMAQLKATNERLGNFIDALIENVAAFQSEMQYALLGDLFKGQVPLSTPYAGT